MFALLAAAPASAEDLPVLCLPAQKPVTADHAVDAITIALGDGTLLRLAELGAPDTDRDDALDALVRGQALVPQGATDIDRYGRTVGQVSREGTWLQAMLVRDGRAWVAPTLDHHEQAAALLALEASARAAKRGIWRSPRYAVREAASVDHTDDRFAILEGEVSSVEQGRAAWTLHFTAARLTLRLDSAGRRRLAQASIVPVDLAGTRIRVRGWPYWAGHPVLDLVQPEQIEFVDRPATTAASPATTQCQ